MSGLRSQRQNSLLLLQRAGLCLDATILPGAEQQGGHTQGGLQGRLRDSLPLVSSQDLSHGSRSHHTNREGFACLLPWAGVVRLCLSTLDLLEQRSSPESQASVHRWPH